MSYIFDFIDNDPDSQFTSTDLIEAIESENTPHQETIVDRLKKHYKDQLHFTEVAGSGVVIQFKKKQDLILNRYWFDSHKNKSNDDKDEAVLAAAVKILRKRIDDQNFKNGFSHYEPVENSFENINEDIPKELIKFLEDIIQDSKKPKQSIKYIYFTKISSIAHSIVSACQSKSFFSPLLLAVGVTLRRTFGSKK